MGAVLVGCMAHARRKFVDAQTAQPKGKTGKADWAINHIQSCIDLKNTYKPYARRKNAKCGKC